MTVEPTTRQLNEIAYHKSYAEKNLDKKYEPVLLDVIESDRRRWWNAYWSIYDILLRHDLTGKKVLVPGCGFGEDTIRLAHLGAHVYAFDISPDVVEIAKARVDEFEVPNIDLRVMPSETMDYADDFFDYVFFLDILHHVDIPLTVAEIRRVVKTDGWLIGDELYTHSFFQKHIRESWLVRRALYPKMQNYIYAGQVPYITDDEHKIDEVEFGHIRKNCADLRVSYYNSLTGRLFPDRFATLAKLDRLLTLSIGSFARLTAGRVVFEGRLAP
jgi:SAM-dependent methyltransferase